MADNKISIDVNVNTDGKQQLEEYTKAFDGLRTSITSLSNPVSKLDSEVSKLNETLNKTNTQNNAVVDTITKLNKASEDAKYAFETLGKAISFVKTGVISLEASLTAGLTVLIAFGPQIIEWANAFLKSGEAIDQARLSIVTMNKALQSSDYSNAIKQIKELKINVSLAKQGFLDKKEVLQQYNTTVGKTMGQVSDLNEAETKLNKNGPAYINMTLLKVKAQFALQEAAKKAYEIEQLRLKSDTESASFLDKLSAGFKGFFSSSEFDEQGTAKYEQNVKKAGAKRRAIQIDEATKTENILEEQALKYEKDAAEVSKQYGLDFFNGEMNTNKPQSSPNHKPITEEKKREPTEELKAISINFAQKIDLEKQNYDTELAALDDQLAKRLISQQQYQEQSQQLQEKYHQNIGAKIKDFNEIDFDSAKKNLEDIVIKREEEKQEELTSLAKKHAQERKDFELQTTQQVSNAAFSILQNNIKSQSDAKIKQLETQKQAELNNSSLTATQKQAIEDKYKKQEAAEKVKAFKAEQKASILQAVINGALAVTKATAQTGVLSAFVIPGIIAETAIQVATIASQKTPQYAKGGLHYQSDGRGALLSGYSRTDNTNAYLRSGEAVVVSEAMRNPWARNLVSAINVAHGGRDFSITNPGRGYAIGGIFTDGGNSNRYYNQPMNDQKDLANTIAYQMINNFPPVYVDVKDINSQQNILAQTVNRVNL